VTNYRKAALWKARADADREALERVLPGLEICVGDPAPACCEYHGIALLLDSTPVGRDEMSERTVK